MKLRILLAGLLASVFFLTSCLKNTDRLGFQSDKGSIVSEIATVNQTDPLVISVEPLPAVETIDLITLAFHNAKNLLSGDIKIKLELDPQIIDDYNTANGTSLLPMPFTAFSLSDPSLEITIPKATYGEHQMTITITKSALSLTETYGLGFKIVSVSEGVISDLAGKILVMVGVKNKYDGAYELKGHHNRSPYNFPYITTMHLVTSGPSSVNFFWPDVNGPGHPIGVGPDPVNDISWYGGAIAPALAFDAGTNVVTSAYNTGGSVPIVLYTGPGAPVSRFDPVTKTVYAYFYYYTAAGQDFSNRGWNDTLTYIGPR